MVQNDNYDFSAVIPTTKPQKKKTEKNIDKPAITADKDIDAKERKQQREQKRAEKRAAKEAKKKSPESEGEKKESNPAGETPKKEYQNGVWVGNLSFSTSRKDLFNLFASCGEIIRVNLPLSAPDRNKGYAYVDFATALAAKIAVRMSECELNGRNLLIKLAKDFSTTGRKPRPDGTKSEQIVIEGDDTPATAIATTTLTSTTTPPVKKPLPNVSEAVCKRKLFVGNLPFDITRDNLEKYFAKFGQVETARMAEFEDTGRCKGFGHVVYQKEKDAITAVQSGPHCLNGRMLRVEFGQHEERIYGSKKRKSQQFTLDQHSSQRQKITFD